MNGTTEIIHCITVFKETTFLLLEEISRINHESI